MMQIAELCGKHESLPQKTASFAAENHESYWSSSKSC